MSSKTFSAQVIRATKKEISVKIDAGKFERLAAVFGMFNREFLASLSRAERDHRVGRTRKINSLEDLR